MNDLSVDLGHIGDLRHPDMLAACKRVIAAAHRHGKLGVAGGAADPALNLELLQSWLGADHVCCHRYRRAFGGFESARTRMEAACSRWQNQIRLNG